MSDEEPDDEFELTVEELAAALPNIFGHRERRVWLHGGRAHVELREISREDVEPLRDALEQQVDVLGMARLVDLNTVVGRAIFEVPPDTFGRNYFAAVAQAAEVACGLDERPFPLDRPKYPPDAEPIARLLLELAADSGAATLGTLLKLFDFAPSGGAIDLAALVSLAENTPRLRGWLEARLGDATVEVGLGTAGSFFHAVGSGPLGPGIDLLLKTSNLRGELARRWAWLEREDDLLAGPRIDRTRELDRPTRPRPVPAGELDRYADEALYASLGGFAVGLLDTESLEVSFAPLFGGLPKAARYGHESFVSELLCALGDRGSIVLRPAALERLPLVDAIVLDGRTLLAPDGRLDVHAENLGAAIRTSRLEMVIVGRRPEPAASLAPQEWIGVDADEWCDDAMLDQIERLQSRGHVVAVVSAFAPRALLAADVGIGLHRDEVPPWEADVVCTEDLDDATFLVEACATAREVAEESVVLAATGAVIGGLANVGGGIDKHSAERVMGAVNAASVLALGNGLRRARALANQPRPPAPDETPWHTMRVVDVLARMGVSDQGLSSEQVEERREAPREEPGRARMFGRAVAKELVNPFTPILAGGAALSAIIGSTADAAIVGAAIALSAGIGGVERYQSERSIAKLEQKERVAVRAIRDGRETEVEPEELAVGDLLLLSAGEVVPADCRVIKASGLEVDQSSLTGESLAVSKDVESVEAEDLADRSSMLFADTVVTSGAGRAVVVATGARTQAARAARLARSSPEAGVEARLREIAEMTLPATALSGALLATVGLARGRDLRSIVGSGVGLAVASVPEGLPLLSTVAQLAAARRLADHGIIVRNPRTIEALGRMDVLCVDKTGTLTQGRILLHGATDPDGNLHPAAADEEISRRIVAAALRATPGSGPDLRHATDLAIVESAEDLGVDRASFCAGWQAEKSLPFGHDRAYHAVLGDADDGRVLYVKGAPETLLSRCKLSAARRKKLVAKAEDLAAEGMRLLCVAKRTRPPRKLTDGVVDQLELVGLLTFTDPIRETSAEAMRALRAAGIAGLMITGDHPRTAYRIAIDAGLVEPGEEGAELVLVGTEIESLTDEELAEALRVARVVARATPLQKVRIVRALQSAGHTVGMTGDGGNDASAIHLADVGIALGRHSSRAARHAADMIVVDPRLETIVDGIAEGRAMWPSVRDAVALLIGGNLGEIGFTVAAGVFGRKRSGLTARQLLLVNLLTDIAPAIAIALRPPSSDDLRARLDEGVDVALGEALERQITTRALAIGGAAAATWAVARTLPGSERGAATVALLTLVGTQLGQTLASGRQTRETLLASFGSLAVLLAIVETPGLSSVFDCRPLGPIRLGLAVAGSLGGTWASRDGVREFVERTLDLNPAQTRRAHKGSALEWPFAWFDLDSW